MKVGEMSFQCSLVVHMMAQTDSSTQYHSMFSQRSDRASSSMTVLLILDINLALASTVKGIVPSAVDNNTCAIYLMISCERFKLWHSSTVATCVALQPAVTMYIRRCLSNITTTHQFIQDIPTSVPGMQPAVMTWLSVLVRIKHSPICTTQNSMLRILQKTFGTLNGLSD